MALIERFTPRGNLYAHGSSTFATLVTLFRRMAETRDAIDAKLWSEARDYTDEQVGAVGSNAMAYAQQETAATAVKITTVESEVDGHETRISAVETMGGLAPGDVSDATVANLLANTASSTRVEVARAFPLRTDIEISAAQFGAKGDGVTDDTAALNSFLDHITANGRAGFMPGKNYRITGTLVIPSRAGWSLRGNGNRGTLITQDTENIPVIQLGNATSYNLNHFSMRGLWFTYKNAQPATNTNAVCILHYDMPWQATFDDLGFKRGHYGTKVRSGVGCPWGGTWDNIHFGDGLTGGAMDWSTGINRVPNNRFGRIYVELGPMAGPVFSIRGYNFVIDTIEFIEAATDAPKLFVFGDSTTVEIGTFKVENTPIAVGKQLIELAGNSYVNIGHLNWKAGGRGTGSFTTGTPYLFSVGSNTAGDTTVHVGNAELEFTGVSTSPAYLMRAGNADTSFTVDRLRMTNGWKAVNNAGNADGPNTLRVSEWANGRIRTRGNADYTVTMRDPNINRFTTAFTAPRTIMLPTDGDSLFNGLTYEFIFDGAINGANTAIIKAGTLTLRTVSTDRVKLQYTYERHGQPASGWKLTAVQSLA